MRVLQIVNSPEPGGVLSLSNSIAEGLSTAGIAVDTRFVTPRVGMSMAAKLRGTIAVGRLVVRGGYDAVIAYQGSGAIALAVSGLLNPAPLRIVHQTTLPRSTSASVRAIDRLIGSVGLYPVNVVNTAYTKSQFDDYPRRYRQSLVLIEHGVAPPAVTRSRAETLARHALPTTAPIILNTGRLVEQKNHEVLIRALPEVPAAHLVIAGGGHLGERYAALARTLGVHDRIHMLGALAYEETMELYGAADLFVFPSVHETFGISAVEAVMLGITTLVSDLAVFREVLSVDGRSAVAFLPHDDPAAWAAAMNTALRNPPEPSALVAFGAALREKYSEARMVARYLELLDRSSTEPPAAPASA